MPDRDISRDSFVTRPDYMGRRGLIASGHYLAARAGQRAFDRGGNAVDAVVASGFALNLLKPHLNGLGGEVPMVLYSAAEKKVYGVSGQGFAGKAGTPQTFRDLGVSMIPGDGFLGATVPAAFGSWAFALMRFGKLTLKDVLAPAIDLAEGGFPMYRGLRRSLLGLAKRFREEWPSSAELYLPGGKAPEVGELFKNPEWAATMKKVVDVETAHAKHGRADAVKAAIDFWYKGEPAATMAAFMQKAAIRDASKKSHKGLLTKDDFARWSPKVEPTVSIEYRGLTVHKCGPWTQGPVFLQQLRLLEGFDLKKLGHNTADYVHTLTEAAKLAFADRERYYGDPDFVKVPLAKLLSKEYADERRKLIDPNKANADQRPGDAPAEKAGAMGLLFDPGEEETHCHDTTHTCAVDAAGNMCAATCSGGWIPSSPVVPGLGFPMGTRGQMFDLDPHRPNVIAPYKRPRTTLTPSLAMKGDQPYMVFGTPGGDSQDQWTLQFFLNHVDFGLTIQQAIDRPNFHSTGFPSSFYPRKTVANGLVVEGRIPEATRKDLEGRGHAVKVEGDWSHGIVMAAAVGEKGVLRAGVSPRGEIGYVSGE